MTCGEKTGHRVKSGELCRVNILPDAKGCLWVTTAPGVVRKWKVKGLKAMLAMKIPKDFIDQLDWATVEGVAASRTAVTKLLLEKRIKAGDVRAFNVMADGQVRMLESTKPPAEKPGVGAVRVILSSESESGCRYCLCQRCTAKFAGWNDGREIPPLLTGDSIEREPVDNVHSRPTPALTVVNGVRQRKNMSYRRASA